MIYNLKYERALIDPAKVFGTPEAVVKDTELDYEQKLAILRLWANDAKLMEIAEEENMGGGPQDMLERILLCIQQIKFLQAFDK